MYTIRSLSISAKRNIGNTSAFKNHRRAESGNSAQKRKHLPYDTEQEALEKQYRNRANIVKNAAEKLPALGRLLDKLRPETIRDMILFVSDKQMEGCMKLLAAKGMTRAKITEEISAKNE